MFTGLIESSGLVVDLKKGTSGSVLMIDDSSTSKNVRAGDSVAIDGACLTVRDVQGKIVIFDVSMESLERTIIGEYRRGRRVNCELAMRADSRMGGHFVLGHVDAVGTVKRLERSDKFTRASIAFDRSYSPLTVEKGSISINGVSLTINEVGDGFISVMLIPHTLTKTNLIDLRVLDRVNIEFDILGKYVMRFLTNQNVKDMRLRNFLRGQDI